MVDNKVTVGNKTLYSRKRRNKVSYSRYGYLFIAPFFIVYAIFHLYPLLYTFYISFTDYLYASFNLVGPDFVGLKNYIEVIKNPRVTGAIKNTAILWIVNYIPQLLLALLLAAWFTDPRLNIRRQGTFKVMVFMPNIMTAATIAVLFYALFSYPVGPINSMLAKLNIIPKEYFLRPEEYGIEFFRSPMATRLIISFIQFWMWYGHTMIILIAGIMGIDPEIFESAEIDGATGGQIFRNITLPLIKPIMLYTLVTSLIGGLQMFDIPKLLLNGGPDYKTETITMYIFGQAMESRNYGKSAAVSIVLFILTSILSLFIFYLFKEEDNVAEEKGVW